MGEWKWIYSSAKNFGGYKEYRAWFGYDRQDYDTYCRCWWSIGAEMKYGSLYGVRCELSGGATASSAGVLKSSPGGTWTTIPGTRKDGYVDVPRGHTATTLSFTSKAYGSTVDGYGGAGSGSTSVPYTYNIPARASYTVSFNANGGSGAPAAQTKWYNETLKLSSTTPSKTGYTFLGWATSSSATSINYSAGGSYTANSGTTLYAVWKKTLTLSYNANGGSGAPSTQTKDVYNSTTSYSFTIPSTEPTLDRYIFKGWGTSASAATASYQPNTNITISSNTTLYAIWELGYVPPVINSIYAVRTLQNGTENDDGTYARLSFKWSIDTEHDVTLQSITVEAKEKEGSSWTTLQTVKPSTTSGTFNKILTYPSTGFNTEKSYDLRITVKDNINNSVATSFISQAFYLLDVNADGTGLSIGAPADDGVKRFRCAIDAQFDGEIKVGVGTDDDNRKPMFAVSGDGVYCGSNAEVNGQVHAVGDLTVGGAASIVGNLAANYTEIGNQITWGDAWTGGYCFAFCIGNWVYIEFEKYVNNYVANTAYTAATLPANYTPRGTTVMAGFTTDGSYNPKGIASILVNQNRQMIIRASNNTGSFFFGSGWYKKI